jgi:hypothetical protein
MTMATEQDRVEPSEQPVNILLPNIGYQHV